MTDSSSPYIYEKKRPNFQERANDVINNFPKHATDYVKSLFPIAGWIGRYNLTWLTGDIIAGLTAGSVVIPQGMAYAKVAGLPVEYGLYSSFVGVSIYFLFATSKDITIGPTAVMSLLLGQVIPSISVKLESKFTPVEIASSLALFAGIFSFVLGFLRLGLVVDIIPAPVIAGFTTGSAITIVIGQIAKLMGIKGIDSKESTYLVLGKTLAALPRTKVDAAFGFLSLIFLYGVKYGARYAGKRWPKHERLFFFIEILRNVAAVILGTIFSFIINIGKKTSPISILKDVPSGFRFGVPNASLGMLKDLGSGLAIVTVILLLEHVAIAKSFGRINNYKISESQEFIAIGLTNAIGSLFHAYPATGSFSRTAIKSKSGVRTPFDGVFSAILVVVALFSTAIFYYIPDAVLAAVIIHAVFDLIASPTYVKQLWEIQFWDFMVFVTGVVVTIFVSIDWGIIASTCFALVVLLVRVARPRFELLGQLALKSGSETQKYAYVPVDHPAFASVKKPPEGVLIFRLIESLTYPNASYLDSKIVNYARENTKSFYKQAEKKGDRPWNELPGESEKEEKSKGELPRLRAVIFDFAAVSIIDSTGLQALSDVRKELNKYSDHQVEYHFANITNESIEESLIVGGFDTLDGTFSSSHTESSREEQVVVKDSNDEESTITGGSHTENTRRKKFFHLTLDEAVDAVTEIGNL